jgi:hypothetical protein
VWDVGHLLAPVRGDVSNVSIAGKSYQ